MLRLVLALIAVGTALPDVAPNPVPRAGETIAPRKPTAVEMSAETVRIRLGEESAKIEASFVLRNTGADKEDLEVGFPTAAQPKNYSWNSREGMKVTEWGPLKIQNFTATVDGQDVKPVPKTSTEKNSYQGWVCWAMSFDGNQKRDVKVSYTVNTRDDNYSEPSCLLNRQVTYILKTGAGWKGNIGEATIILDLGGMTAENIIRTAPEPTTRETSTWTWTMKDFEPNADILVQYRFYANAKEAVEKLEAKLKKNGSDNEALIDYAENLLALEQPLRAAEIFGRLHEAEKKEGRHFFRSRTEYQPPAYRAAKCFRDAGRMEEARAWAAKAADRLEEVSKENIFSIRKGLRTSPEKLAKALQECRTWASE
jgi:uncharacterized protein DUF4424